MGHGPVLTIAFCCLQLSACALGIAQEPRTSLGPEVRDLPLIELPLPNVPSRTFALMLTGDGGWATLDRKVSAELVARGLPVVALNTRAYLSRRRTPDQAGLDLSRIIRYYVTHWSSDKVAIVGYSRGADIAPFMVSRLPADLKSKVVLVAMLALSDRTNFEFHFMDIFVDSRRASDVKTLPELDHLRGMNLLCVYGADEKDSACRSAPPGLVKAVTRSGGHHFDNDFKALGDIVFDALPPSE
jgi:type IV secretory pathway VirJ component